MNNTIHSTIDTINILSRIYKAACSKRRHTHLQFVSSSSFFCLQATTAYMTTATIMSMTEMRPSINAQVFNPPGSIVGAAVKLESDGRSKINSFTKCWCYMCGCVNGITFNDFEVSLYLGGRYLTRKKSLDDRKLHNYMNSTSYFGTIILQDHICIWAMYQVLNESSCHIVWW